MREAAKFPSLATINRQLESVFGVTLIPQVQHYLRVLNRGLRTHGVVYTCKYLKDLYAQALRLTGGLDPVPIPFRRSNKKGFDRNLTPFGELLMNGTLNEKRACLTVLRLCYLLESRPKLDLTSIESGFENEEENAMIRDFTLFTKGRIRPLSLKSAKIQFPPRARSGPNGRSSFGTAHFDAVALTQRPELLQDLADLAALVDPSSKGEPESTPLGNVEGVFHPSESATEETSGCGDPSAPTRERGLKPWIEYLAAWSVSTWNLDPNKRLPVSRLALLSEGGCKTRTIAIVDLFTQAVLRPLHTAVMRRLSLLSSDCTHNQQAAVEYLKHATKLGRSVYSFDLTNATDRFPLELQRVVMSALFGDQVGVLWANVIAKLRDFDFQQGGTSIRNIYYKRGQPMGAYSSWPAFAYTHHIFVQWCAHLALGDSAESPKEFGDYRIIGDDVIIANEKVGLKYREKLEAFGVSISEAKSLVSVKAPFCGEIAKRFVIEGYDHSPLPPDLIKLTQRHVTMLPALLDQVSSRYGLDCSTLSCMQSLKHLYRGRKKRLAAILLAAPALFALYGYPYYGPLRTGNEPGEESQLLTIAHDSPWSEVGLEFFAKEFNMTQIATREAYYLRQYDSVIQSWKEVDNASIKVWGPKGSVDKTETTPCEDHPIFKASTWIWEKQRDTLIAHAKWRLGLLDSETNLIGLVMDAKTENTLRFTLDPSLRSFLTEEREKSNTATHLTLDVLKVLRGDKEFPKYDRFEWTSEEAVAFMAVSNLDPDNEVLPNEYQVFGGSEEAKLGMSGFDIGPEGR